MAKKKKPVADHVRNKRKEKERKTNPFEVKVNRQKHDVLGRKVSKHDKGMPGLSRSKAIKRRMDTLLPEYKQQFKSNKFVDRRFGENDTSLSLDEKMMKRYALERAKSTDKNKYNLNEDEELTHYGQSLSEIEKFDEPDITDDEDDDDDKRAAAKLVAEEHFGGFLKKRSETDEGSKTWKERMEDLISQSKKAKHERQMEKEKTVKITEDLDAEWKDLQRLVAPKGLGKKASDVSGGTTSRKADEYDLAVRELQFEIKGKPSDRLKTDEEIAKEEQECLEKQEADRNRRMMGISEDDGETSAAHKSADDLDDGFALDSGDFDYVSYKDGALLQGADNTNPAKDGSGSDDRGDDADGDDDDKEDEEDDDDAESDDSFGDLESDKDEDSDTEMQVKETATGKVKKQVSFDLKEKTTEITEKRTKATTEESKEMIEKAKKELPYTFKAPASYDDLLDMLQGHDLEHQLTIIERIRKCHHPSLAEGNKQKLESLFAHLVQFFGDLCIQDPPQLDFADRLVKHLYELSQMSPVPAAEAVLKNISDRQVEFKQICERKAGRGLYPALDTLLLLKLVSLLFPTSDFHHPVTTPALMFIGQILSQCPVNHGRDVAAGLFLCNLCLEILSQCPVNHGRDVAAGLFCCNLCLEYVSMSKKYIPEVVNFLHGMLFMAAKKEPSKIESVILPFKPVGKNISLLLVSHQCPKEDPEKWSLTTILPPNVDSESFDSDGFKSTTVHHCVTLLLEFSELYTSLPTYRETFAPVIYMCKKLPTDVYPQCTQTLVQEFTSQYEMLYVKKRSCLMMQKKKPKPLKMFEPKMEDSFDGKKKKKRGTRDFNEKQKLLHKHKKEMKGARREIKKDNQFLARQKLQEQTQSDAERKRKVKDIYHKLSVQEGDYKKMKRGHVT